MRKVIIAVAILVALVPARVYACSGLLDCAFGWTDRANVRADSAAEIARIKAAEAEAVTRAQGEADARVKQAEAEVERVRQMQFESAADRDIAIAQANAKRDEYAAMIAGLTDERVTAITAQADTQIAALQEQSKIAIEGIVQTGQTERWRVAFGWATVIVGLVIMGAAVLYWMRRHGAGVMMVLPNVQRPTPIAADARQLPWYSDAIEIVEVKHAVNRQK